MDKNMLFWNVIVKLKDGRVVSSMARGRDFAHAKKWFSSANYISAVDEMDEIVEFSEIPSTDYSEFLVREQALKNKYKIH